MESQGLALQDLLRREGRLHQLRQVLQVLQECQMLPRLVKMRLERLPMLPHHRREGRVETSEPMKLRHS